MIAAAFFNTLLCGFNLACGLNGIFRRRYVRGLFNIVVAMLCALVALLAWTVRAGVPA